MAKNSKAGNRERAIRRRAAFADRGIKQILLMAPEQAHPLLKQAAGLMTQSDDPMEPREVLRQAGGANDPGPDSASAKLLADLDEAKSRIASVELDAEKRRAEIEAAGLQIKTLEAERDAAKESEAKRIAEAKRIVQDARNLAHI